MAFAQVQVSALATGTGASVVITVNPTVVNNLVTVGIRVTGVVETCDSVIDDKGNTYVVTTNIDQGTNFRMYMAYGVQVTGGATSITANFSGSAVTKRCVADEYSGNAITNESVFEASASGASGDPVAIATSAMTLAAAGDLIVGWAGVNGTTTPTAGAGYVMEYNPGASKIVSEYRLSGTTSETAPMTSDVDTLGWAEWAMAFKPLAGGSPSIGVGQSIGLLLALTFSVAAQQGGVTFISRLSSMGAG